MGAGKTSAARAAAGALDARAVDADHEIERRLGGSIADHFADHGEAQFRQVEEEVVTGLLDRPPEPVLSLGGGAVLSPRVQALLRRHTVVLLDVDVETAWRRCGNKPRPLAQDHAAFAALHAQRAPLYESLADDALLDLAERRLAVRHEVLVDRRAEPALDLVVGVDRASAEHARRGARRRRLPRAHEADEN